MPLRVGLNGLGRTDGNVGSADEKISGTGKTVTVSIWVFSFHPSTVRIVPGTTVEWINRCSTERTATANDGSSFDTGEIEQGQTKTFTFTKAGTYAYHCSLHPFMTGVVIVK
jgi:plastocyanin